MLSYLKLFEDVVQFLWVTLTGYLIWVKRLILPPPPKSIKNEVILVTGGSSGIGQALLLHLALLEPELTLISWDIDQRANEKTIDKVRALGVKRAVAHTVDVSDRNQVATAAAKIRQEIGDVSMIFNNAGIAGPLGRCWETDLNLAEKTFGINMFSHWYILREFLPAMLKKNRGHIIPTCSVAGLIYCRDGGPYVGSKHAVHGYYECLKEDLRGAGSSIKVSSVYPGHIATNMTASLDLSARSFGFLSEPSTASAAAKQIIRDVLREEEHIYVPSMLRPFRFLLSIIPAEVYRRAYDMLDVQPLKGNHGPKISS